MLYWDSIKGILDLTEGILDMNESTLYCKIAEIGHMYVQIGAPVSIELAACRISNVLKKYI